MKTQGYLWGILLIAGCVFAQEPAEEELRQGKRYIQTKVYTLEEDQAVLTLFKDLRVADVSDGMDFAGLHDTGLVNPMIQPLWKDAEHYTHRIIGIAVTARYVPTNKPLPAKQSREQFNQWVGNFYNRYSPEPFVRLIRPGTVLVIDDANGIDVGSIGSNNIMSWTMKGCVGVITDSTARDTDEIITQKIPLYFKQPGRGIRPGRNELESVNLPVAIGGVLVRPGDVVVADGDGVIVVPREQAEAVARYAHEILEQDKAGRRNLYNQLGLPEDDSVK